MRFSQRVGGRAPLSSGLQEASVNLRTALWNVLHPKLFPVGSYSQSEQARMNARDIWTHLHWNTDDIPARTHAMQSHLKGHFFAADWMDFFDAVEFAALLLKPEYERGRLEWYATLNSLLEREGCAYRFVAERLAPLTNQLEVTEVTRAADSAIPAVAEHIRSSLSLLPPNVNPSPRNSIKEAISAVEAALKELTGQPGATLGEGLKLFESKYGPLHESIRRGLDKLYAYTNGPDGIRHALVDDAAEVTVDDARFMVVTCSAFANYLVALAAT